MAAANTNLTRALLVACVLLLVSSPSASAHTDLTASQARDLIDSAADLIVVDVREQYEYCNARGHIPGSLNYPWNSAVLQARYAELPADGPVLVVCASGGRSNAAANFLDSKGFSTVYDMKAGMSAWQWETAPCKYSGGSGTAKDPYQIATAADLIALGEDPNDYDKHFILTADIDLDPNLPGGKVFDKAAIAPNWEIPFTGTFAGNSHAVLHLHVKGGEYLGLFGELGYQAVVNDLGVVDVNIAGSGSYVGGLTGYNVSGHVTNCYTTGAVSGRSSVGGLVGFNDRAEVAMCYSTAAVSGPEWYIGGLIGYNSSGTVLQCYGTGTVGGYSSVGGLVGQNDRGYLSWCYSIGSVSGTSSVGGLVGHHYQGNITACFWDTQTSGQAAGAGGTAKTTAEMQTASTFLDAGWDFVGETANGIEDIWWMNEGKGYPRLSWEPRKYGGGTGEPNDPYLIFTAEQLNAIGAEPNDWDKHFKLMADIDLSGHLYDAALIAPDGDPNDPAFQGIPFKGTFDGNSRTISHLTIQGAGYLGIFGRLDPEARVESLRLVDANVAGSDYIGALVGFNYGHISESYVTGTISGNNRVGGVTGRNRGSITTSYNAAAVTGYGDVGGIAAANYSTITNCYNTGAITANMDVGGIVGENYGSIAMTCSTGTISGATRPGGLAGYNWQDAAATITASFWDIETSGQTTSDGGTGKTTAEMQMAGTFLNAGWDFVGETANGTENIWWMNEGKGYPRLSWENHSN